MRKLLTICVLAALVLAVSGLSPASAQEEDLTGNIDPLGDAVAESTLAPLAQPGSILLLDGQDGVGSL